MISGFVILRSVEQRSLLAFAQERFFRIIPLCAAAVLTVALCVTLYDRAYGVASPFTWKNIMASIMLAPGLLQQMQVVPVLWSLVIEVYFYALIALAYMAWGRRITPGRLLGLALGCVAVVALGAYGPEHYVLPEWLTRLLRHLAFNLTFIVFILAGSALAISYRRDGGRWLYLALSLAMVGLFRVCVGMYEDVLPRGHGFTTRNAYAAYAVFCLALLAERWVRPNRLGAFFADISYPLYLVHIPLAWLMMHALNGLGLPALAVLGITVLCCIGLAWVLHAAVEKPARAFGKRLAVARRSGRQIVSRA